MAHTQRIGSGFLCRAHRILNTRMLYKFTPSSNSQSGAKAQHKFNCLCHNHLKMVEEEEKNAWVYSKLAGFGDFRNIFQQKLLEIIKIFFDFKVAF